MEQTKYSKLFLLWMIITFIYGAGIFLFGFFPINNYTLEHSTREGRPQNLDELRLTSPAQLYTQTILMLVDALRSDFPTSRDMPFSYKNSCSRLKVRVNIPTVTMPRLKSLMTGTVSNFIDIILNIGHVEQLSDSLLHRLQQRNETAVFAGDRTWISLFPKQFKRFTANVDSFFVNDFYEGDKNVTKVLSKELQETDWMLLVLHYLGLDHIGHVEGSESSKIPLKLIEMDKVVEKLYKSRHFHKQLLLLTGDHGMRDGGGHGGSTYGEMYVPFLIFKENCNTKSFRSNEYNQIDIVPTLAILWSMEIPPMSVGCLIPELLHEFSFEDQLYAYYYNALHLMRKANIKFGKEYIDSSSTSKWFTTAKSAHKQFLLTKRNENFENAFTFEDAKVHYLRLSRDISEQLSDSLVQFDYGLIAIGLSLMTLVVSQTLLVFNKGYVNDLLTGKGEFLCIIVIAVCINKLCHYQRYITTTGTISTFALLLAIMANVHLLLNMIKQISRSFHDCIDLQISLPSQIWVLLGCLVFHSISLSSSSFIENEDKMWHYLGTSALILLCFQSFCKELWASKLELCENSLALYSVFLKRIFKSHSSLLVISGLSILARWNVVGSYINHEKAKPWLSCVLAAGLVLFSLCLHQRIFVHTHKEFAIYSLAAMLIYCYRASKGTVFSIFDTSSCDNFILNYFWIVVGIAICTSLSSVVLNSKRLNGHQLHTCPAGCFKVVVTFLLLISMLLHKPHNVVLVASLIYTLSLSYDMCSKLEKKTLHNYKYLSKILCTILVSNMFYFYQGNSNSFATIDLNPGYIGQTTYNPIIVGILVTLNMYSAPLTAFVYLVTHILQESDIIKTNKLCTTEHINFILYFYTLSIFLPVLIYFWLLLFFRYHLFIYSVFAPKAFYEYYRVIVLFLTVFMTTINLYIFNL
ncbi:GPI ethanolamine phosphate transferase 2 isoform X1 [Anastrepha ludens]|uniref:GPI ethanolamine phosphate transferase 2 isoform X1 n=1 Tax=Anastrepha ludens TaxID=28586 RepID=UPI0023B17CC8|nr:GPI ethanolamine phosphate transferase 2 isoform X1 [Anastrepha ludens]